MMACSLTNQASSQPDALRPWNKTTTYENDVYLFPVKRLYLSL